jgi:cytosine/adenosine deaminase-related metal-dependent hydrolase
MADAQSIPRDLQRAAPPEGRWVIHADSVADAAQVDSPGALLFEGNRLLARGTPASIGALGPDVQTLEHDGLLIPPLVNAHVHLDLSDLIAPLEMPGFRPWLRRVVEHRQHQIESDAVGRAVALGAAASIDGGCAFVGDICASNDALDALARTGLGGVGYREFTGHDSRAERGLQDLAALDASWPKTGSLRLGFSPHAPYSTGPAFYEAAAASGRPVATHLAESLEEEAFMRDGEGPFAQMLRDYGYEDGVVPIPRAHPIDAVLPMMPRAGGVVVHLNYIEDRHIEALADANVTVVYCPRASRYFGHPQPRDGEASPAHPWRALLRAGVPVALGTDGRPCLPGPGLRGQRLSTLDDALELIDRDDARIEEWLAMATVNGARALGIAPEQVTFSPGHKCGLLGLGLAESAKQALRPCPETPVRWIYRDLETDRPCELNPIELARNATRSR